MRFVRLVSGAFAIAALGVASFAVVSFAANGGDSHEKVTLCHATGSSSNPYVSVDVNISSAGDASDAKGHNAHGGDIIPPYTYSGQDGSISYPGKNWTTEGQAIWNDGCQVNSSDVKGVPTPSTDPSPSSNPTPPPSSNPTPPPSSNPTPPPSSSPPSNPSPSPSTEVGSGTQTPPPSTTPPSDPKPPTTGVA